MDRGKGRLGGARMFSKGLAVLTALAVCCLIQIFGGLAVRAEETPSPPLQAEKCREHLKDHPRPNLSEFHSNKDRFFASFNDPSEISKWKAPPETKSFKYIRDVTYDGKWEFTPSTTAYECDIDDLSLKLTVPRGLHAIVRVLDDPIVADGTSDLIIQYEVKFPDNMECGGGYLKLLTFDKDKDVDATSIINNFDVESTHLLVFGPDKCLANSRTHYFLSKYDSKVQDRTVRHYSNEIPIGDRDGNTNLYTIVLKTDGTFKVKLNGKEVVQDNYESFVPPIYAPKQIIDPEDVDPNKDYQSYIIDADAKKPDDWDDNEEEFIPDPNDVIPDGWRTDIDTHILETGETLEKHKSQWDEALLGPYEPLMVKNPACVDMMCGPWKPKMIRNPNYKGVWTPPLIQNPVPPVEWNPRMIDNPEYTGLTNPHDIGTVNAVVFDIWSTDSGIEFDNIYIGRSEAEASMVADATFKMKLLSAKAPATTEETATATVKSAFSQAIAKLHLCKGKAMILAKKYANNPRSIVDDVKELRNDAPLAAVLSTAMALLLILIYVCTCCTKKALCVCKSPAKSDVGSKTTPKSSARASSSAKSNDESSEADDNDDNSSVNEDDEAHASGKDDDKGLKKRKNNAKSSKGKSGK